MQNLKNLIAEKKALIVDLKTVSYSLEGFQKLGLSDLGTSYNPNYDTKPHGLTEKDYLGYLKDMNGEIKKAIKYAEANPENKRSPKVLTNLEAPLSYKDWITMELTTLGYNYTENGEQFCDRPFIDLVPDWALVFKK